MSKRSKNDGDDGDDEGNNNALSMINQNLCKTAVQYMFDHRYNEISNNPLEKDIEQFLLDLYDNELIDLLLHYIKRFLEDPLTTYMTLRKIIPDIIEEIDEYRVQHNIQRIIDDKEAEIKLKTPQGGYKYIANRKQTPKNRKQTPKNRKQTPKNRKQTPKNRKQTPKNRKQTPKNRKTKLEK
jgi:hypothetical protein